MPRPRLYETEAIVIRKTNLGEADRLVTLYTPSLGKIKAIAKGVRRPSSKLGGNVELLTYSRLMLARGRNLDIITQSQPIDSFIAIKSDLQRTSWGLYVAELVDRFTPEHMASPRLFSLLLRTLKRMSGSDVDEMLLRRFELHLLEVAGYRPQLERCPNCDGVLPSSTRPAFSPASGGLLCSSCRTSEPRLHYLSHDAVNAMGRLQGKEDVGNQTHPGQVACAEMGLVLQEYISYILEGRIRSVAWLRQLKIGL